MPVKYELWCAQQKLKKTQKDKVEAESEADSENGESAESPSAKKSATEDVRVFLLIIFASVCLMTLIILKASLLISIVCNMIL